MADVYKRQDKHSAVKALQEAPGALYGMTRAELRLLQDLSLIHI